MDRRNLNAAQKRGAPTSRCVMWRQSMQLGWRRRISVNTISGVAIYQSIQ